MKTAICQVGHPSSFDSLRMMLGTIGYECLVPSNEVAVELRNLGCDTVIDPVRMADNWGYQLAPCRYALLDHMKQPDVVYIDVKAHRNGPLVWAKYPHLEKRTLWYRINGGEPADVPGKGPELRPPCPVLTPCLWYRFFQGPPSNPIPDEVIGRSYACWPPFQHWNLFEKEGRGSGERGYNPPVSVLHNMEGWGYGVIGQRLMKSINLRCYGGYGSPHGLLQHRHLPDLLSRALCMVHLKSNDAPGYALYEALASGCPIILPRRFNHRCRTWDLFQEGETCLMFDFATMDALPIEPLRERDTPVDDSECVREIEEACRRLSDPVENRRIGLAGRERLRKLLWPTNATNIEQFAGFMQRMFP